MTQPPADLEQIAVTPDPEDDRIARISLDTPESYNVITHRMLKELHAALTWADTTPDIHAIVFGSTADNLFCAGADLNELSNLTVEDGNRFFNTYVTVIDTLWGTGKPVIAAVTGNCVAGGNELVMACDMIIAGESARFGQPEAGVGSTAAGGGVQLLPLVVGLQRAKDLLYTGRLLTATEAEDWGLINRVVPDDDVPHEARALAQAIIDHKSPQAFRVMKAVFNHWKNLGMANREVERELTAAVWASDEFTQRAQAFLDREDLPVLPFPGTLNQPT